MDVVHVVPQNVDVKISVASMAVTNGAKSMIGTNGLDRFQQGGQFSSRNHRIFFLVCARRFHRLSHPASQEPERLFLSRRFGKENFTGTVRFENGQNSLALRHEIFGGESVHFNQQMGGIVWTKFGFVGVGKILRQKDRVALHEFQSTRHGSRLKNGGHSSARSLR